MSIACVAIIGKENEPLYIRIFPTESKIPQPPSQTKEKDADELKYHYHVHCALDIIDEKVTLHKKPYANISKDLYLGQMFSVEDLKVYGYMTNTKIKFVVILRDLIGDSSIKGWLKELHALYVLTVSNPFFVLNSPIDSPKFDEKISRLALSYTPKFA